MNEQLPPVDPTLRRQLSRRASGPLPSNLLSNTMTGLDASPRPRRWRLAVPRAVAALGSLAVVALVVVALAVVPSLRTTPTSPFPGYPADRALTTDELARVLADPELKVNTALVASVTIELGQSCPTMNVAVTFVIKGITPTVCVQTGPTGNFGDGPMSGTWAFRYLGSGFLGIVNQVLPASPTQLSYKVGDEWPQGTSAFLVRGYLGALESASVSCAMAPQIGGDVMRPDGLDCPYTNWLSDEPTAPEIEDKVASGVLPKDDLLSLRGTARYVSAGGARIVDSLPHDKPIQGVYVVQLLVESCPGALPIDSRGCSAWRVLARVADLSLPANTATPTPVRSAPLTGYPSDRALTTAELAALMAGPALAANTAFTASVTIDARIDVCPMNRYPTVGVIEGMPSQTCVMGAGVSDYLKTDKVTGTFAFRVIAPGVLGLLGQITPASSSRLSFHAADTWPKQGETFLVDAWLGLTSYPCPTPLYTISPEHPLVAPPGDALRPNGADTCNPSWLADDPNAYPGPSLGWPAPPNGAQVVNAYGARMIDSIPGTPVQGTYVLTADRDGCLDTPPDGARCGYWRVLARVAPDPGAALATAEPPATPIAPPTPTPTRTLMPTPLVLPSSPNGAAALGLWGQGNRPFTTAELPQLWAADPAHLAGRIVIVKGPVPAGYLCWSAGQADAGISPPPCHIGAEPSQIAADGHYWAVKVGADGKLTLVGEIKTPESGGFVFDPVGVAKSSLAAGDLVVVAANLILYWPGPCGTVDVPRPSNCGPWAALSPETTDNAESIITLPTGSYQALTGSPGEPYSYGPPIHGFFLVRLDSTVAGRAISELAPVTP